MPAQLIITPAQHETIHNVLSRMLVGINGIPNILFLQDGDEELGISEEDGQLLREVMQLEGLVTNADGPGKNHLSQLTATGISVARSPGGYRTYLQQQEQKLPPNRQDTAPIALSILHPVIQQAAGSRFASGHYSDAIQKACTALEKVVQAKAGQPATITGTSLMTTAFSKNSPLIQVAADPNEQFGFMNLYQGAVQALRNHYAHNLTELTDPTRALEWLGFISALLYKLDEAPPMAIISMP
jgi:uncharacterized protein (TIGR02391 family)